MTVQQTLSELVAIDSVSARTNAPIIEYLQNCCEAAGFVIRHFSYVDESEINKINLVAVAGGSTSERTPIELALVGHTDTVPYDPNWNEATKLTKRDDKLFGRGA